MERSQFLANKIKVIIRQMNQEQIDQLMPTPPENIRRDINRNTNDLDAELRIAQWVDILRNPKYRKLPEKDKLELVNKFFNEIPYQSDNLTWRRQDYWATPTQILSKNLADCEDYALAKYLTLRKIGVLDDKLRLTIVKSRRFKSTHMVLTYKEHPNSTTYILDNNSPKIRSTLERHHYFPLYSFNSSGVHKVDYKSKTWEETESDELKYREWDDLKRRLRQYR